MNQETTVKYLVDKGNTTGSIKETVEERRGKAFGITADILSIANSVPLGQWRVKSDVMLRKDMIVNGTLYNSECWQGSDVNKKVKS